MSDTTPNVTSMPEVKVDWKTRLAQKKTAIAFGTGAALAAVTTFVICKSSEDEDEDYSDMTAVMDAVREDSIPSDKE